MEAPNLGLHKLPPQNLEAEQCVLGALLIDQDAIAKVLDILSDGDLYREAHRRIFAAAVSLFEKNEPIDLITISDRLGKSGALEEVGGVSYLATLADSIPTAANITYYARIVKERAVLRNLIKAATQIVGDCYDEGGDVDELLDRAEKAIFDLSDQKIRPGFSTMSELMIQSIGTIEQLVANKSHITGVPTGFDDLDHMTHGFQPSDLIVVAGRPSMGKTSLCLNIAEHVGVEAKRGVVFFSLEMSKEQLGFRLLCSRTRIDSSRLKAGRLRKEDWPKLTGAAADLSEAPIFIDDAPAQSALEIRAKCRRLQRELHNGPGLSLVIIDYLQLMRSRRREDARHLEVSEITRSLKALAKELKVPVVALSQLSRAVEQRTDRRPQLADLRESGAIEQDADVVMFVFREEFYHETEENRGKAQIIIGKQRNGPTGSMTLHFHKESTAFENYTPRDDVGLPAVYDEVREG
ncbi:MAG: replicative DNA helicase [Candidatus Tectomicrobia bacterium]|nr:replicative DNA helicase [Candidatus Tectomicrobia bacterium]